MGSELKGVHACSCCGCYALSCVSLTAHTPQHPGLYTLSPAGGSIAPGASEEITLRFSPTEVEDCSRLLVCEIPDLDPSCKPLTRSVTGKVGSFVVDAALRCQTATACFAVWSTHTHSRKTPLIVRPTPAHCRCCGPGATLSCLRATT